MENCIFCDKNSDFKFRNKEICKDCVSKIRMIFSESKKELIDKPEPEKKEDIDIVKNKMPCAITTERVVE